jgi:hypothetical protein
VLRKERQRKKNPKSGTGNKPTMVSNEGILRIINNYVKISLK